MQKHYGYLMMLVLTGVCACSSGGSDDSADEAELDAGGTIPSSLPAPSTPIDFARVASTAGAPAIAPNAAAPTSPNAGPTSAAGGSSAAAPMTAVPAVTPPPNTEKFTDVGTQPFVLTAHDPFSTFAADVDTASYDIFRRNVEHDLAPAPAAVRVEEFVNYFDYDYPAPEPGEEHPFRVNTALSKNPLGRDTLLLRVGIQAQNPPAAEKKPANLVFLVDVSGSMLSEDKLPLVKFLLTRTLEVLDADDKVSIVTYAGGTAVRLPPTSIVEKEKISQVIDGLNAGGSTNGAGGIQLAYEQAKSARIEDGINHVILCTDGDFNVGISDTKALVELIEQERKSGTTLTALGFGIGNLNDAMMEKVSNAGNGIYSVITSQTQASRYAEDRMLRTFIHVAKDLKIQLEWNPERVEAYRLIGYEDRAIADQDFRNDEVDAGEIGAGHRVTALYEVVPKGGKLPEVSGAPAAKSGAAVDGEREIGADDLVLVKVRYKQPGASESDPAREVVGKLTSADVENVSDFAQADQNLQWTVAIAGFAELIKQSPYAAPDKLDVLRGVFSSQQDRDVERKELLALFDKAVTLLP